MLPFDLIETTIAQIQAAFTEGNITSRDLVTAYLARIEAYDKKGLSLNAISVVNGNALAEAENLDQERSVKGARGPLHGIPVLVKDNYETRDMQTAAGSILLKDWLPPDDAFLVKRLREAGAIIIAKTNMHEFAIGITTVGSLFGETCNPYALDRNPGGSSGGAGAALAANFGMLSWGSDTCGSIRIPAAHNNLVGLWATQGLLSRAGIIPLSHTQDIGGPLARTVADAALALEATVGYDPEDPQTALSLGRIPASYSACLTRDGLQEARIGLLVDLLQVEDEDREVADIIKQALTTMQVQGAKVLEVSIPKLTDLLTDRFGGSLVLEQEFKFDLDTYLARQPTAPIRSLDEIIATKKFHPAIEEKLKVAQSITTLDTIEYREHLLKRSKLKITIYQTMIENGVEVLVYPSIRQKAMPLGEKQPGSNCKLSANSGLPAITVPAGFTSDGLPVGLEMLGLEWDEPKLLKYAYAYEQATRHRRLPQNTPAL
jgi:amidase